jgi:hypothetical protein
MISSNLSIFFLFVALTIRNQSMMYQIPRPPPVSSLMIPLPQSPIRKRSKPKYPKKQETDNIQIGLLKFATLCADLVDKPEGKAKLMPDTAKPEMSDFKKIAD